MSRVVGRMLGGAVVAGLLLSSGCVAAERASTLPQTTTYAEPSPPPSPSPGSSASPTSRPASAPAPVPRVSPPVSQPVVPPVSSSPAGTVSATVATPAEIVAALTRAGVPTPARWADVVVRSRPYPANDPSLGELRQALAAADAGPDVIEKIVAVLRP